MPQRGVHSLRDATGRRKVTAREYGRVILSYHFVVVGNGSVVGLVR